MKAMVGSSILIDSYEAGIETARNSMKGLKNPKVGLLFSSIKHNQEDLISGIKSVVPEIKIIGCTSSGAIMTPDGIISNEEGFAGMMILEDNELKIGISSSQRGLDPRSTGRKIAKEAMEDAGKNHPPVAFAMFASPKEEEEYLKGIQDIIGEVPMFGGSAADNDIVGDWKVLCGNSSIDEGCAVALFYTTKEIKNVLTNSYKETDNIGIITSIDDNRRIMEIDHVPALKKYAEWTGFNADELMGQSMLNASIPMAIGTSTLHGETILARHPQIGNPDYSLTVGANMAAKTAVMLIQIDEDGMIGGAVENIIELKSNFKTAGLLLIHSSARKNFIGERIDEDYVAIKNAVGDLPFIVTFTSSEYGQVDHSGACIANLSLSFTGFSE
jgi:hypothetical protein